MRSGGTSPTKRKACLRPIRSTSAISYDVDGAREVVLPETGILLAPRDVEGLGAAILRLAADAPLRRALGGEGRRRFAHQFRHETMTSQLRSLYERLLNGPLRHDAAD